MSVGLEVALISGGITLIGLAFNLAAGRANRRATQDNTMAALDAAHAAQLWERRADTYVDAIQFLKTVESARKQFLRQPAAPYSETEGERLAARFHQDDWSLLETRLSAYASDPVLAALTTMRMGNDTVMDAWEQDVLEQGEKPDEQHAIGEAVLAAMRNADQREEAAVQAMRADLAARPSAAPQAGQQRRWKREKAPGRNSSVTLTPGATASVTAPAPATKPGVDLAAVPVRSCGNRTVPVD